MPDHFHWLVGLGEALSLSEVMRRVKGASAYALNVFDRCFGRRVWQAGFHDHELRREEDLRATARYIVANPLRAGLVEEIGDYPYWDAVWLEDRG